MARLKQVLMSLINGLRRKGSRMEKVPANSVAPRMNYTSLDLQKIEAVFNKLGGDEGVQRFLKYDAEVVIKTHRIDCSSHPYIPSGMKISKNQWSSAVRDVIEWDFDLIIDLFSPMRESIFYSYRLFDEWRFRKERVLPANVLDFLLIHPHLVPEAWKNKTVHFLGTIYIDQYRNAIIRYLNWNGVSWNTGYTSLDRSTEHRDFYIAVLGKTS